MGGRGKKVGGEVSEVGVGVGRWFGIKRGTDDETWTRFSLGGTMWNNFLILGWVD